MYYTVNQLSALLKNSVTSHISVIHFNIRSLPKHYDDLVNFLTLSNHNFSVICMSETWLSTSDDRLFSLPNHHAEFNHRPNDRHGGSAIFISNALSYKRRSDISFSTAKIESVWIEFDSGAFPFSRSTIIASIYRSPSACYTDFCKELEQILNKLNLENKNIIIVGDINIDITDVTDSACSEYSNCFLGHGLESLIQSPTRCVPHGPHTLIDHISSNLVSPQVCGIVDFSITGHSLIFCFSKIVPKLNRSP